MKTKILESLLTMTLLVSSPLCKGTSFVTDLNDNKDMIIKTKLKLVNLPWSLFSWNILKRKYRQKTWFTKTSKTIFKDQFFRKFTIV